MSDDLLAVLILTLIGGVAAITLRPVWRNDLGHDPDHPPGWWVMGVALWRGFVRLNVIATPLMLTGAAFLAAFYWGPFWLAIALWVPTAFLMGAVATIGLFARPKFLIAPHLRHQPGAIAEWMGKPVSSTEPPRRVAMGGRRAARSRK